MSGRAKYLLVCSITSGRQFPEKRNTKVLVEGKFNDEILESDPVPLVTSPQINTELAWEMDKKSLHQHKMQRTPVKLNIMSLAEKTKELLGYIVLDLRAVALNVNSGKWMNLLNNKYTKFKSELHIKLSLEEENATLVNNVNTELQNESGKLSVEKRELNGKPFLQVGKGGDMYVFSLSILKGSNLLNLLPSKISAISGFYWFYMLRGNDVIYNPFGDLSKPFPMERASMNIRATKAALFRFLISEVNYIEVHLCTEEYSLGSATVDYSKLLNKQFHDHDFENEPLIFEEFYAMNPSGNTGGKTGGSVKIMVTIRREHVRMTSSESEQLPVPHPAGLPIPKVSNDYDTDHGIDEIQIENRASSEEAISTTDTHLKVPPVSNHFTFSIELLSLSCQFVKRRVQLRYSYPFFGSIAPVSSGAPILITRKNEEIVFSEPFCQFSFACPPKSLESQFITEPFIVHLIAVAEDTKEEIIGNAIIPLQKLIPVNLKPKMMVDDLAVLSSNKLIGNLKIKYWIENKGPIHQQIVIPPHKPDQKLQISDNIPVRDNKSDQFQAALELELWKAEEEETFTKRLKQKETETLIKLSEEFAQRETQRETLMARKVAEYEKLEKQLRKALHEAKKGELSVLEKEKELGRIRQDLQKEKDRIRQDGKTTLDQQKRELTGLLKVERAKTHAAEERARIYRAELDEYEAKYKCLLKELEESKRKLPDANLQVELRSLMMEKSELEKKVESQMTAKAHYKQQLAKAVHELTETKQREQESALERVKRQQEEIDRMRVKYTIHNEEKITKHEQTTLRELRNELDATNTGSYSTTKHPSRDTEVYEHAQRLRDEKEMLLKSGVYSETDRVIQDINLQIKEALLDA